MPSPHSPLQNQLLAALPETDISRILPDLELVRLESGDVLCEPGNCIHYGYFPTNAIISMLYVMNDGASDEIAIVGNEGVVGISVFLSDESTNSRAVVLSTGYGYRLRGQLLKNEFFRGGPMQCLMLRYTQAVLSQIAQTAVCNRHHSVEQQFCCWLLFSLDRLQSNEMSMTQELIARMLGVRREGINESSVKLHKAGLINYSRGRITVVDRVGLEALACECYASANKEFYHLLSKMNVS